MILVSSCSCLCPIHWNQVLNREWRCSWSSADRRCSNYIWVISNLIAYKGATYIRDLTVIVLPCLCLKALAALCFRVVCPSVLPCDWPLPRWLTHHPSCAQRGFQAFFFFWNLANHWFNEQLVTYLVPNHYPSQLTYSKLDLGINHSKIWM